MKTMKFVSIFLILGCVLAFQKYAEAQYKVPHSVCGNGSTPLNNGSYRLNGTVGQPGIGVVSSTANIHKAGFWYQAGMMVTSIESISNPLPKEFRLEQNYPNPFNPSTTIQFALPKPSKVTLKLFDVLGKEVATLVEGLLEAGQHKVLFNAHGLPSGQYFYHLQAGDFSQTRKLIAVK